ncbi:MAG TPA: hypothetical protein VLB84_14370 [Bacteroidia bacterium]|jgi:hypothetical protein|nr:hypothetical protein [Bacteroidia bacterium]
MKDRMIIIRENVVFIITVTKEEVHKSKREKKLQKKDLPFVKINAN